MSKSHQRWDIFDERHIVDFSELTAIFQASTNSPCGSGLARESGGPAYINVECHDAFASKPAPTGICVVMKHATNTRPCERLRTNTWPTPFSYYRKTTSRRIHSWAFPPTGL
ncbi:hypothetical protein B0E42_23450 [Pseudomonas sp. A25(2017)]|nr:hypothetical protein B0E42_23450 [Pseudomonas sp. A25(2017)]